MSYCLVRANGYADSTNLVEYVIDSSSDVSYLPTDVANGSVAYTANLNKIYIFKNGTWVEAG